MGVFTVQLGAKHTGLDSDDVPFGQDAELPDGQDHFGCNVPQDCCTQVGAVSEFSPDVQVATCPSGQVFDASCVPQVA
jgi:hypothetical protein